MKFITFPTGSYMENCSLAIDGGTAWIIDPGSEPEKILRVLAENAASPRAVLLTHAHFDHVSAVAALQRAYPNLPVYVHKYDIPMFGHAMNCHLPEYPVPPLPQNIRDAMELEMSIETPGHTPGGVCYYFKDDKTIFTGDTLFAGSVGRTDLPGGSMPVLMESLEKLVVLDDDVRAVPGHGPATTIGAEKFSNPYL